MSAMVTAVLRGPVAGILQVGWIIGQIVVLRRYFFLQPVVPGAGYGRRRAGVMVTSWAEAHTVP